MSETEILEDDNVNHPFRENEEKQIVSLALDSPEFMGSVAHLVKAEFFDNDAAFLIMDTIKKVYDKCGTYTRGVISDALYRTLNAESDYEPISELLLRPSDPREVPYIRNLVSKWAKHQAYGLIFYEGSEVYNAEESKPFDERNYEALDKLFDQAQKITEVSYDGIWFFDNIDLLFRRDASDHFTTGFKPLDLCLNTDGNGHGPGRGEVTCWLGPTNAGKSIVLVNNGLYNLMANRKVLHITLEMSKAKTMQRYTGAYTGVKIIDRMQNEDKIRGQLTELKRSTTGSLYIQEYPAREVTVNEVSALIRHMERTYGWHPDVIIIDYLELMMARRDSNNDDDYVRQRTVSAELRGLASKEDVTIFTATQANRAGAVAAAAREKIGLDKVSESWGKNYDMDYVISINPGSLVNEDNENIINCDLHIAKNRNGPCPKTVPVIMDKATMRITPKSDSIDGITI